MLGKYHILITLLLVLPFLKFFNLSLVLLILISGLITGSLLPDAIDANNSYLLNIKSKKPLRRLIYFTLRFSGKLTRFTLKPLSWVLKLFFWKLNISHRGLWHSLLGILIISFNWLIISLLLSVYLGNSILFFTMGIFLGCFTHLLQDSFTVSGINWLYPFNILHLKGKIKTIGESNPNYSKLKFLERNSVIFIYFLLTSLFITFKFQSFKLTVLAVLIQFLTVKLIFKIKHHSLPSK